MLSWGMIVIYLRSTVNTKSDNWNWKLLQQVKIIIHLWKVELQQYCCMSKGQITFFWLLYLHTGPCLSSVMTKMALPDCCLFGKLWKLQIFNCFISYRQPQKHKHRLKACFIQLKTGIMGEHPITEVCAFEVSRIWKTFTQVMK